MLLNMQDMNTLVTLNFLNSFSHKHAHTHSCPHSYLKLAFRVDNWNFVLIIISDCIGIIRKEILASSFWCMATVFFVRFCFSLTPKVINRLCTITPVVPKVEQ